MNTKLLSIADDLTGAVDTGVQFARAGIATFVTAGSNADIVSLFKDAHVVVVNSETRHSDPAAAAKVIEQIVTQGQAAGVRIFYKKTDSTLRGNIGSELDALRRATGRGRLAFAPALPQLGRTTVDGFHFVHGRLLHQTGFAVDPLNPIQESFVPRIIARQTSARVAVIPVKALATAESTQFAGDGIYVFDAETELHLKEVAQCLKRVGMLTAMAGPAGLAAFLPDVIEFERRPQNRTIPRQPMLLVNGSVHDVSLAQSAFAAEHGFQRCTLGPPIVLSTDGPFSRDADNLLDEILASDPNADLLLQSAVARAELGRFIEFGNRHGLHGDALHFQVANNTARFLKRLLEKRPLRCLIVFGGDTLVAIARELNWTGFYPEAELLPGVTYSKTSTGFHLISKAGGFGAENLVEQIQQRLT